MNDDPSQWRAWSEKIERARAMKPRGTNMHLKPPPKPADARQAVTAPDNRQMVALKSDVKMELDYFLVHTLEGTGIGRSAFIMAAMEILSDPFFKDELTERGLKWQSALPR